MLVQLGGWLVSLLGDGRELLLGTVFSIAVGASIRDNGGTGDGGRGGRGSWFYAFLGISSVNDPREIFTNSPAIKYSGNKKGPATDTHDFCGIDDLITIPSEFSR